MKQRRQACRAITPSLKNRERQPACRAVARSLKRRERRLALLLSLALSAGHAARSVAADSVTVRVGIANASSDVGFFIADRKGYFRQEGIDVTFTAFDSGAKMIAPLGLGRLDVGAGSPSAGLYNAVARGIVIKIVADKGSTP